MNLNHKTGEINFLKKRLDTIPLHYIVLIHKMSFRVEKAYSLKFSQKKFRTLKYMFCIQHHYHINNMKKSLICDGIVISYRFFNKNLKINFFISRLFYEIF